MPLSQTKSIINDALTHTIPSLVFTTIEPGIGFIQRPNHSETIRQYCDIGLVRGTEEKLLMDIEICLNLLKARKWMFLVLLL